MDFNEICIATSPMYALPDKQLSVHKANTSMYLRDTFTLHVDSFHNSDPLKII